MVCRRCGRENPDGFRFCSACGAPAPVAPDAGEEQERKVISAVFCDLVGFTQRAELMDPEDVHALLRTYYASVRPQFERFGGTVAKFIGDAVYVLYGAPRAHEDDPERAVRAALAALQTVADLNAALPDLDLHLHIGVTTGEALVTLHPLPDESGGLAWGDILNTASRLEAAAPPDTILVDDATYRATRHVIDYQLAEPVRAKGKAEPVPVWQPVGLLARESDPTRQPIVGRGPELALLAGILDGVRTSRAPQLVTIVGETGIGKSRLVLEFYRRMREADAVTFRIGRSPPYPDGVSFWALGEIVKSQAGMLETDGAAAAGDKLHAAVRDLVSVTPEAARIEGHLRSLVGLGTAEQARGDQRGAAFAAWRHFLEALARRRPLVLVFEDVQWADDGLLDFIEHLAGWARDVPLLILATARPELRERRPDWAKDDLVTEVPLPPLSEREARELVSSLAGERALSPFVTDTIVASAAGNPLYSVEFIRMMADRGLLAPGAEATPIALGALPVPETVRSIIASRLDSLPPEEKALIQAGAVMGRVVWPGALSAVTGHPRRWVVRRLRLLEDRAFLAPARQSSVENEFEYRFRHVLIRDVAYGAIPRRRRGEIHRRTAEWLESLSPDRAADRAEMLAHHYLCALKLTGAASSAAPELADRTRRALADAGDRALALHSFPAAARHFRAALELWPDDDPERPWLLFRLGKSTYYAETAGAELLEEARDGLLALGDRGAAAEAESFLAYLAHHQGWRDQYFEHLDHGVALVRDLGPSRSKAEVLVDLANHLAMARDHERTIAAATEALEISRALGLSELEASALAMIGVSRGLSGDLGGREDLERAIAIAEDVESHLSAHCCGILADLECNMGELETCFALQARARLHAERFGHAGFVRWLAAEKVGEGYWTGDWDGALALADQFIAESETGTPNFMEGYCRAMRGHIRLARGESAATLEDATRAVAFARTAEDPQMLYPALAFAARAEIAVGSLDDGAILAEELLGLWSANADTYPASSWAVDLAYALDALGRGAELVEAASGVGIRTRWLDAVLCVVAGDFEGAAALFHAIGSRPDEAFVYLRAAQALFNVDRKRDGRAALAHALAFYRPVAAITYLREAEILAGPEFVTNVPSR